MARDSQISTEVELSRTFQKLKSVSLALIVYTLVVILWGAWVRVSHSGDGCGDTWPLCHGQIIPEAQSGKTWVEYSHRFTSGLYGILVVALFLWLKRASKKIVAMKSVYRWSFWVLVFMVSEALLGAKLVIFGLVSDNESNWRILVMSLHQINSFIMMGFTVRLWCSTWPSSAEGSVDSVPLVQSPKQNSNLLSRMNKKWILAIIVLLAVTGAWAALSTTLFPTVDLWDGLMSDFSKDSHLVLKIRIAHPLLALSLGSFLAYQMYQVASQSESALQGLAYRASFLLVLAMVLGMITLLTLSPVPLKMMHLLSAHVMWIAVVSFYHFYKLDVLSDRTRGGKQP